MDRPGLLAVITAALAASGASVHAAELTVCDGIATDQFSLTDREGAKLQRDHKGAIRDDVLEGLRVKARPTRSARR